MPVIRILGDSPVTIDNTGTIKGAVIMGNGDDSFTNAGSLYTDEVDMGGGSDTLVNNGTIWLSSTAGTIANVESFTHSGLIDLANGTVGDTLSISGEFVSAGGSLYLDASLDSGTADLLTLHTVAASSNPTLIHVTGIGSGPTTAPILLVDADSDASNGNAFTLATNTIGAYEYELAYDAAAAAWYLPLPSIFSGAAEYPALVSGSLLAFASDLPALHERLRESFGDGKDRIEPAAWRGASQRLRPWIQLDTSRQDISSAAAYDLDVTKIETGLDARTSVAGSLYAFGAFAGAGRSLQKFHGSSSEADADILTAGFYGAYRSGPFQARGIVKYEHQALAYSSDAADDGLGLHLLGLSLEAAYRLERGTAYLEPRVGLSYAHAWAGSFADASGAAIDLDDADSLSGELAARWGLAAFHLDLALRHEVSGRTSAEVSGLTFSDELPGTVIRMASGLDWSLLDGMLNVSLDAGYAKGNDAEELSATAALRFSY